MDQQSEQYTRVSMRSVVPARGVREEDKQSTGDRQPVCARCDLENMREPRTSRDGFGGAYTPTYETVDVASYVIALAPRQCVRRPARWKG